MITENNHLISVARALVRPIQLSRNDMNAATVGCALLSREGNLYTGVCVHLSCGLGFCAEAAAIADMLKAGETEIHKIVAASALDILPPCGRCREMMVQVDEGNFETRVILEDGGDVALAELLPHHWMRD
jgi:cytidine deaminase